MELEDVLRNYKTCKHVALKDILADACLDASQFAEILDLADDIRYWIKQQIEDCPIKNVVLSKKMPVQVVWGNGYRQAKQDIIELLGGIVYGKR